MVCITSAKVIDYEREQQHPGATMLNIHRLSPQRSFVRRYCYRSSILPPLVIPTKEGSDPVAIITDASCAVRQCCTVITMSSIAIKSNHQPTACHPDKGRVCLRCDQCRCLLRSPAVLHGNNNVEHYNKVQPLSHRLSP